MILLGLLTCLALNTLALCLLPAFTPAWLVVMASHSLLVLSMLRLHWLMTRMRDTMIQAQRVLLKISEEP